MICPWQGLNPQPSAWKPHDLTYVDGLRMWNTKPNDREQSADAYFMLKQAEQKCSHKHCCLAIFSNIVLSMK